METDTFKSVRGITQNRGSAKYKKSLKKPREFLIEKCEQCYFRFQTLNDILQQLETDI